MAVGLGCPSGGIFGLLELVAEHREAIEYELLDRGYGYEDIGTRNLSWGDLRTLVQRWQHLPGNAFAESLVGHAVWSVEAQLIAGLIDVTSVSNYYLAKSAGARSPKKPKPIPRPWDAKPQTFGKGAIPFDEIDAWISTTIREE